MNVWPIIKKEEEEEKLCEPKNISKYIHFEFYILLLL